MTRTLRGYIARRRRKKSHVFASNNRGAHSRLTRSIIQQTIRALASSHRDRGRQKRNFRRLWITRINAVIREIWVSYSYGPHGKRKATTLLAKNFCKLSLVD